MPKCAQCSCSCVESWCTVELLSQKHSTNNCPGCQSGEHSPSNESNCAQLPYMPSDRNFLPAKCCVANKIDVLHSPPLLSIHHVQNQICTQQYVQCTAILQSLLLRQYHVAALLTQGMQTSAILQLQNINI